MPMILRSAVASPFSRKVKIAAYMLGLDKQIEVQALNSTDPNDPIQRQNPLAKIPTLVLENGKSIYDSRVILEYLDTLAGGGKIIPKETAARFDALTLASLADGIMDASILIIYESRYRPDQTPHEGWLNMQRGKIVRSLNELVAHPPAISPITVGTIGLACALGYLDFRKQVDWRASHPALIKWLEDFRAACPTFDKTRPEG
jgi:glutathione S-transferase